MTLDTFRHTLNMLGAKLTQDEAQMVSDKLAARTDGLVDYEGLYRLLLQTPPPQVIDEKTGEVSFRMPARMRALGILISRTPNTASCLRRESSG